VPAVRDMVSDYTGADMSERSIREIVFTNNTHLLCEILEWGVEDTEVRSDIIGAVTTYFQLPSYPTYGDTERYKKLFFELFEEKVTEHEHKFQ